MAKRGDRVSMTTLAKESEEHERLVKSIIGWYAQLGFWNIKAPADEIEGSQPDVQADSDNGRTYGEAKLCEDFPQKETKEQLTRYSRLVKAYRVILGVPAECRRDVEGTIEDWKLEKRILVRGF